MPIGRCKGVTIIVAHRTIDSFKRIYEQNGSKYITYT